MDLLLLQIDPIAFHLGPIPVRWYGLLIVSGIILAYIVGQREAVKRGLPEDFLQIYYYGQFLYPLSVHVFTMCQCDGITIAKIQARS